MKKIKTIILLIITVLGTVSFAQTGINSPYSRYGLGQLYSENLNTPSMSMGGLGIALHHPTIQFSAFFMANPIPIFCGITILPFSSGRYSMVSLTYSTSSSQPPITVFDR